MAGRPHREIDETDFKKLCGMQATLAEISGFFDVSDDTIERWCKRTFKDDKGEPMGFSAVWDKYSANGKISLRRYQFELAKRNAAMAIFLGKQYLGQRDVIEQTVMEIEDLKPLADMLILDGGDK